MAGELKPVRVRPAIRRIATWVVPVLLLIGAWQIWDAIEARRLEQALAPVLGPPVPTAIRAAGTDDGAGRYYAAAAVLALSVSNGEGLQTAPGGPIVDATTVMRDALAQGGVPPSEAIQSASRQLERGRPVFDLLARASSLPFKGFDPGTEFNYRFSGLLDINGLAGLETMSLIMNAQGDRAARVLVDRLRLLRAFGEDRSFMQMVGARQTQEIATDIGILLGRSTVVEERLSDLDRALSQTYSTDALARAIRGDVLWMHHEIRSIWEGRSLQFVIGPLLRPVFRHHAVMRLQVAADALAAAQLPWPDRINVMNGIPDRRSMVPEIVPFVAAWREASQVRDQTVRMAEAIASVRCARLVIAIERYRASRNRLPDALNDIVNQKDEIAIDPFSGKPLVYARSETGYVVYSLGRDGKDEGGKFSSGLPPWQLVGKVPPIDIGVRVILNKARRAS